MQIVNEIIEIQTAPDICIFNVTPQIARVVEAHSVQNGHAIVLSRHTTTALAINEYEERLLEDVKVYLDKLVPKDAYLHDDLHLRKNIPPDEPMNARSHLMAMMLGTSEAIPIVDGKLALGTYQSVLFFELDGPRKRTLLVQICGE